MLARQTVKIALFVLFFVAMTVTDNKLRVVGVSHLRVIDASVFPRSPSANLQGPTMMVAERGAQFIRDTWISYSHRYY